MDKKKLQERFLKYISGYNDCGSGIELKAVHSFRVADITDDIAESLPEMKSVCKNYFWALGLLHDIGRFEQLRRYGTFIDADSVDHAELGADILFKEGLIDRIIPDEYTDIWFSEERDDFELAIRLHNKLSLPNGLDVRKKNVCNILRDADKVDIFRVACESPFEVRMSKREVHDDAPAREDVMNCIRNHTCVPKLHNRTEFECHLAGCAMAFELVYPRSIKLVKDQGYLKQMLNYEPENKKQYEQMKELRKELARIVL